MKRTLGYRYLEPSALARLKNLSLIARGVVEGYVSGLHSSPYKGFSSEFADHREYSPGDNTRHLDWRALGRTDRLHIKQYEEETNLRAQILLDVSGSMAYRSGDGLTKQHYAAYLVAMLTYLMTRQQDAVGLTLFDTSLRLDMPARSSARHLGDVLRRLEEFIPQTAATSSFVGQGTNIAQTLHQFAERFQRRCLIVLISDLYDDPQAVMQALGHFRYRKHEVIVFHVFDKAELEFPFRETATFLDMETGERLQVDPAYVREDYRREMTAMIDGYRRSCRDRNIEYVLTDTTVPYDFMLSRYLSKRSRL
jgi:uncharacterized protein (DUF58 family)